MIPNRKTHPHLFREHTVPALARTFDKTRPHTPTEELVRPSYATAQRFHAPRPSHEERQVQRDEHDSQDVQYAKRVRLYVQHAQRVLSVRQQTREDHVPHFLWRKRFELLVQIRRRGGGRDGCDDVDERDVDIMFG